MKHKKRSYLRITRNLGLTAWAVLATTVSGRAADLVATWDGSFLQNWSDASRWSTDEVPNNGAQTYDAIIPLGNVIQDISAGVTINNLELTNAFLSGDGPLAIVGDPSDSSAKSSWTASGQNSEIRSLGEVLVGSAATLDLLGSGPKNLGAPGEVSQTPLRVDGVVNHVGTGSLNAIGGGAQVAIASAGTWNVQSDADFGSVGPSGSLTNEGLFIKSAGSAISRFSSPWTVENLGTVRVETGTLEFRGPFANNGLVVLNGGSLLLSGSTTGAGNYSGAGTTTINADYSPADGVAAVSFGGDVVLGFNSDLNLEIAGVSDFDQLAISGTLALDGELSIVLLPTGEGEELFSPAAGDTFTLASADGGIAGSFSNFTAPAADEGFEWTIEVTTNDLLLRYDTAPLAGDFNEDGVVNAADYTVWRDTIETTSAYNTWSNNYGATPPESLALGTAIPEPSTITCMVVVVFVPLIQSCRGRRSVE